MTFNNGSYEIKVDNADKKVNLYVSGTAEPEAIHEFLKEYNDVVNKVQVGEFDLIVDCLEMSVETQDKVEKLIEIVKMYQQSGFKNIIFKIKSTNAILKMQMNRIIRNSKVDYAQILEV